MTRAIDAYVEAVGLSHDETDRLAAFGDAELNGRALAEIEAIRRGLVLAMLSGADRTALIVALDGAERRLRQRLAI